MAEPEAESGLRGSLAGAREPTADQRSNLPNFRGSDDEASDDLKDISKVLLGVQAISGKALTSAGRMTVSEEARQAMREQQQRSREDRQARELANLARWNAQMTTVGGVQMTNEQAQKARQNVVDNGDAYADWAVRKGLICEDEKDEFKAAAQRKKELEDKRGRGTLTAADADEEGRLDRSRAGRAAEAAAAQNHLDKGHRPVASADEARSAVSAASALEGGSRSSFPTAPDLNGAFASAAPPQPAYRPMPVAVAPMVKATGLDL